MPLAKKVFCIFNPRPIHSAPKTPYEKMLEWAEEKMRGIDSWESPRLKKIYLNAWRELLENQNPYYFLSLSDLKMIPVPIEEFMNSSEFLGDIIELWDTVREDVSFMNPDVLVGKPPCREALLGGATGSGKSTASQITVMYQMYLLNCFNHPQALFDLAPSTHILFTLQSLTRTLTERVLYKPLREMFLGMPFVRRWMEYDRQVESEIRLSNNIDVVKLNSEETSLVGQAIIGCIMDEVNFMAIVQSSRKTYGARGGTGGHYDQAEILYRYIAQRRNRSFITRGPSIGCLCIISSARFKNDFLSRRMEEVRKHSEDYVYVACRKRYDCVPKTRYCGNRFRLLVGDEMLPTRVLMDHEKSGVHYPSHAVVEMVPIEHRAEFLNDPERASRDILGVTTGRLRLFFRNREKIQLAFDKWKALKRKIWVYKQNIDLLDDIEYGLMNQNGLPKVIEENLPMDRSVPRWVGVDLSKNKDLCGIAITRPLSNVAMEVDTGLKDGSKTIESLPRYLVEVLITIKPYLNREIDIPAIRQWIMALKFNHGFNIVFVAYDGFQSKESVQLLNQAGIRSAVVSVDRTMEPYEFFRDCLYQGRLIIVDNPLVQKEMLEVEEDLTAQKVDHPENSHKDGLDAAVRSVYVCGTSRFMRAHSNPVSDEMSTEDKKNGLMENGRKKAIRRTVVRKPRI